MQEQKYIIAIDDTDMPGTRGTGWLVQQICEELEQEGFGDCSTISRHQLFVHPDVPYTSHNSSMCFELAASNQHSYQALRQAICDKICAGAKAGSDPGLCIIPSHFQHRMQLIAFGMRAKHEVLNKKIAYALAQELDIDLSEHGGTGDGIIGALAGVGLRLSGNDGRYRGWFHLGLPGTALSSGDILNKLPFLDEIINQAGEAVAPTKQLLISCEKLKTVRQGGKQVLLTRANELFPEQSTIPERLMNKDEAKAY